VKACIKTYRKAFPPAHWFLHTDIINCLLLTLANRTIRTIGQ